MDEITAWELERGDWITGHGRVEFAEMVTLGRMLILLENGERLYFDSNEWVRVG